MDITDPSVIVGLAITLTLFGLVGVYCGRTRDREREGLILGVLFGPIGWLIILLAYPYVAPVRPDLSTLPVRGGPSGAPRLSKYQPKR